MKSLKVALLIDSGPQPLWMKELIEEIRNLPGVELALVLRNAARPKGLLRTLWNQRHHLLYYLFERLDRLVSLRIYGSAPNAFRNVDLDLEDVPTLDVEARQTAFSDYLRSKDVERIQNFEIDVALRFGFRILRGDFLNIARLGVWSLHHGDNRYYRGGPACFWEVAQGSSKVGAVLQVLSEELDSGQVIGEHIAPTFLHSFYRTRNNLYWKAKDLFITALNHTLETGKVPPNLKGLRIPGPLYRFPTNGTMLKLLPRFAWRWPRFVLYQLFFENRWALAYRTQDSKDFIELRPPHGRFWADPFPVVKDGRTYVFFEEYFHSQGKGVISVGELIPGQGLTNIQIVLETPTHLSYPLVFEHEGEMYMIPESAQAGCVDLYRCAFFPYEWTFETTLLDGVTGVDATPHRQADGTWRMYLTETHHGSANWDRTYLYEAPILKGPWKRASHTPISSDVRTARGAGHLFWERGHLLRPTQDCSKTYGFGIHFVDVDSGKPHHSFLPPGRWKAVHTWNEAGGTTLVDFKS